MKFDAVILDVDGTVWNSTPLVAKAWTAAAKKCGMDREITPEILQGLFGKTMHEIADELMPEAKEEDKERVLNACLEEEKSVIEENDTDINYPDVNDTIKSLSKRIPVCIVSNCQSGYIELFVEKNGLEDYITDTECYGNNGLPKAENIKLLVERNGFKKPVYVGDTVMDEEACDAAGVPFIFASYGFGEAKHPIFTINGFKMLENILN